MDVQFKNGRTSRPTRHAIIEILKSSGPQDAFSLAEALGVSPMAVRLHLYQLRRENLADFREEPRPRGRPRKVWHLTRDADGLFPDGHWSLLVSLLGAVRRAFGNAGFARALAVYCRQQARLYRGRIQSDASLGARLRALCAIRSEESYMAQVVPSAGGGFLLVENHCPIITAVNACGDLCSAELDIFKRVLGKAVVVERCEHILSGSSRCVYRISTRGCRVKS